MDLNHRRSQGPPDLQSGAIDHSATDPFFEIFNQDLVSLVLFYRANDIGR